ncbi:hypothetical protein D3C87_1849990 [compost metagenome]
MVRQVHGHDIGRCQRRAGMGQQRFGIELGVDGEHGAGFAWRGHDVGGRIEVMVERAFGGFVELS